MLRRLFQPFFTAYVVATFFITLLLIMPFTLTAGLFDNSRARRFTFHLLRAWSRTWLFLIGMPLKRTNAPPPPGKYIVVANHRSYIDGVLIFSSIPGYFRALGKKEVSHIPLIGLIYRQVVILVDRSSTHSRTKSMRLMWRFLKHEGSVLVFPEGTFNETEQPLKDFYDGAFRLAINCQVDVLPMVFPDAADRMHFSAWWKFSPGKNRVIYGKPFKVSGLTLQDLPLLKSRVYTEMESLLLTTGIRSVSGTGTTS
jgi:1-acyl-sn-glycerol-3-phosphate acyltransferase